MEELSEFIESTQDARELKRALAVKMVVQGYSYYQIRDTLLISIGFVSKWKRIFVEQGIAGLKLKYTGSVGYLNQEQTQAVVDWLKRKNYWNLVELKQQIESEYNLVFKSNQSYYDLFKQAGISWKKTQKKNPKKDWELVEKKSRNPILAL